MTQFCCLELLDLSFHCSNLKIGKWHSMTVVAHFLQVNSLFKWAHYYVYTTQIEHFCNQYNYSKTPKMSPRFYSSTYWYFSNCRLQNTMNKLLCCLKSRYFIRFSDLFLSNRLLVDVHTLGKVNNAEFCTFYFTSNWKNSASCKIQRFQVDLNFSTVKFEAIELILLKSAVPMLWLNWLLIFF